MSLKNKLHKYNFIKHFSTTRGQRTTTGTEAITHTPITIPTTPKTPSSTTWRIRKQQENLVSQVTQTLLQRHNWSHILQTLDLSSQLTPSLFLQILDNIQSNPLISIQFINWVTSSFLSFRPDIECQSKIIHIVLAYGEPTHIEKAVDLLIEANPPPIVVDSMLLACKDKNLHCVGFSSVIESYACKGLFVEGLDVYKKVLLCGYLPNVGCLNAMLKVLDNACEFKLAYCFYGSMIRNEVLRDDGTWSVFARILSRDGKFESVVRVLKYGVCNPGILGLVIDGYSKIGNFRAALDHLDEMCRRKFEPRFRTYCCIVNGACQFGNVEVVDTVMSMMMEKKLIPKYMVSGCDDVIMKVCDLGMVYAAEYLFKRGQDGGARLKDATFGCMLSAFCRGGRVNEAIELYRTVLKTKIVVNETCYRELADCLCQGKPVEDKIQLLTNLIERGFLPSVSNISKCLLKMGKRKSWEQVEALMNVMLQAKLLPDSKFYHLLVNHYCSSCKVDLAVMLHDKMRKMGKSEALLDVATYNIILRALFIEKRVNEAVKIYKCIKWANVVNTDTFVVMISGLSREKEMRKAMQVHDEMLKLGIKPSSQKYKKLISVFR